MNNNELKDKIIYEFKKFLNWETQSYENWEKVELFIAETLSEAWLLARPHDSGIFEDTRFKRMVDEANGKWLEKQNENDSYKIILSTRYHDSINDLTKSFIHEMRHCLDYQNAVEDLPFDKYHCGNEYYCNWSEFRAVYAHTRYEYYSTCSTKMEEADIFNRLSEILGASTTDCVIGLMRSENNLKDTMYFISRYIGASRAIRNLSTQEKLNTDVFHLWHLTPYYIIENYGNVFYIGNEWDETDVCKLDAIPNTYYYNDLVDKLSKETK